MLSHPTANDDQIGGLASYSQPCCYSRALAESFQKVKTTLRYTLFICSETPALFPNQKLMCIMSHLVKQKGH